MGARGRVGLCTGPLVAELVHAWLCRIYVRVSPNTPEVPSKALAAVDNIRQGD